VEVVVAAVLSKLHTDQATVRQVDMDLLQSYIFTHDKKRG
jgi:hypothetical protein